MVARDDVNEELLRRPESSKSLKFNSSPLKFCHPKRKVVFEPSVFRGRTVKLRGK